MRNKYKNIDDLFRDKFENFEPEPPEHIWANIKTQISDNRGAAGKSGLSNGSLTVITVLLISAGLLSSFLLINTQIDKNPKEVLIADAQQGAIFLDKNSQNDYLILQTSGKADYFQSEAENISSDTVKLVKKKKGNNKKKDGRRKSKKAKAVESEIQPEVTSSISSEKIGKTNLLANPEAIRIDDGNVKTIVVAPVHSKVHEAEIADRREKTNTMVFDPSNGNHKGSGNFNGDWSLGLFFTPEMIRYPSDINLNNHSYGLDVLATWKKNNLLVQSGLGFSLVKDQGDYEVNFNKFVGSYEDVYDVTFDSIGNEMVPTFHTETVNIYDSINHISYAHTKRSYTYLQVPVLIGYTEEFRRFGWFIKTGAALSFLVKKNIPDVSPTNDPFRLLTVNSDIPDRISTQWSYPLSAGINYKAGNKIHMSVEPLFRYHINPAYERNSLTTKHPYSFGLRLGILYNF